MQLEQLVIVKKDGREVTYNRKRIVNALTKAYKETDNIHAVENIQAVADSVEKDLISQGKVEYTVMDIQDLVVHNLHNFDSETASKYLAYAQNRIAERDSEMDLESRIDKLSSGDKAIINENANKDSRTFTTKRDLMAGQVAKAKGLRMLPRSVREAHLRGDIHYHDADYSPYLPYSNCSLVDIKFLLENGFDLGNASIEPPKSIQTAISQTLKVLTSVSGLQYGGTSFDRIDEVMAPYAEMNYNKHVVKAKKYGIPNIDTYAKELTKQDIYAAFQSLEYEINTLNTANGQTPFVTIGFGLGTSWFEKEIQKAILEIRLEGLGKNKKTAIFPKLLFTIKEGLNKDILDPNYDVKKLALKCAAKRMYPDILNYDKIIDLTGSFKCSMGCRSFLQGWKDSQGNEVNSGRMNLGVVTLNLPRIAMQSEGDKKQFWKIFEQRMKIIHKALKFRKERVFEVLPENAPVLYQEGAFGKKLKPSDNLVDEMFLHKRATISIGYIGLYEVGTVFYGSEWENLPEAKEFTLSILKRMKELGERWSDDEDIWYSVYGTPSESLADRFCRLDTIKFGSVKDITDKEYYTNSFHYDVRKNPTPFEKIDFEKDYPKYASGGFINYIEYPNIKHNIKALETVWDYSYDKIGYLGTNTPVDKCYVCGSEAEFKTTAKGFECVSCGNNDPSKCDVVRRTCGYLGNPMERPMVHGRQVEISSRKKHI